MQESVYKELIRTAQEIMKNSIDPVHSYEHAQRVVDISLEVANELALPDLDRDKIELIGWWHDVYKATHKTAKFSDYLDEGEKSVVILKDHLQKFFTVEELEAPYFQDIFIAIENHPQIYKDYFKARQKNIYQIILQEADGIETINTDRVSISFDMRKGVKTDLFHAVLYFFLTILYFFYPMTKFARKIYFRNIKKCYIVLVLLFKNTVFYISRGSSCDKEPQL